MPDNEIAQRMRQTYEATGDEWFKRAAEALDQTAVERLRGALARIAHSCAQNGEDAMRMRNIATAMLYPEKAHIYDPPPRT